MPQHALLWMFLAGIGLSVIFYCLNRMARFNQRTIADLTPFFRKLNSEYVEEVFDERKEEIALYHSGNPRRERRRRLELARECLRRMDHNTRMVLELGNTEYKCLKQWPEAYNDLNTARIIEMRQKAMLFNHCVFFALAEMWFWMLLSS